eukprot:TRINITY_DN28864_c0_g1_i1.p1 TRINITY_DN28864_c0_g1~~TRINITY_DN28864_c0_g1_i1.p1  ORF type:complete len:1219 (+),score=292.60 TRINITY_DN28864_c0_g1_i1:204-3860(+)
MDREDGGASARAGASFACGGVEAASAGLRNVQRIWVDCSHEDDFKDIAYLCKLSQRARLSPRRVSVDVRQADRWHHLLELLVRRLPKPYSPTDPSFLVDVDTWLSASVEEKTRLRGRPGTAGGVDVNRWPSLLVTHSPKLVAAVRDGAFREALAAVSSLQVNDLLPVVLSADFGLLSGLLVSRPPLDAHDLPTRPGVSISSAVSAPRGEEVRCGVYMMKAELVQGPAAAAASAAGDGGDATADAAAAAEVGEGEEVNGASGASPAAAEAAESEAAVAEGAAERQRSSAASSRGARRCRAGFGARCLVLCADGRGAYSAVSSDGLRRSEASGEWRVLNGHVVLVGKRLAKLWHLSRSQMPVATSAASYEEPVHISLEQLHSDFDPPVPLAECLPSGGALLRWDLLLVGGGGGASRDAPGSRPPTSSDAATPRGRSLGDAAAEEVERRGLAAHSLEVLQKPPLSTPPEGAFRPRLLGEVRGLRETVASTREDHSAQEGGSGEAPEPRTMTSTMMLSGSLRSLASTRGRSAAVNDAAMQELLEYADSNPGGGQPWRFMTCPLKPGRYRCEQGHADSRNYRRLSFTLHAAGGCKIRDESFGSVLKSHPGAAASTSWRVEDGCLLFDSRGKLSLGFSLQQRRGTRCITRNVACARLPVDFVLAECTWEAFPQQLEPFFGYESAGPERLLFGLVDPDSPVLAGLSASLDWIPYNAFEQELRLHGLECDEILSDFSFLDRNADGHLSVAELRALGNLGLEACAPEVMSELRDALLLRFFGLGKAFRELSPFGGALTSDAFFAALEHAVKDVPAAATGAGKRKERSDGGASLARWLERNAENRSAVFQTLVGRLKSTMDLEDLQSLGLHTALLAVRRMEHFQAWVFSEFGNTHDVLMRVYSSLDLKGERSLTRQGFILGAEALGYPCREAVSGSVFALLDRNFDGIIAPGDFHRALRDFNARKVLNSFDTLRNFAKDKFGSLDALFERLLVAEGRERFYDLKPKSVSYSVFSKVLRTSGLGKETAFNGDLRTLFLFLDEATGKHADGFLNESEWALMKGFDSRSLVGSPARLLRLLEETYGGVDMAFQTMHTSWLQRALLAGLRRVAVHGAARAFASASADGDSAAAGSAGAGGSASGAGVRVSRSEGGGLAAPRSRQLRSCQSSAGRLAAPTAARLAAPALRRAASTPKLPPIGGGPAGIAAAAAATGDYDPLWLPPGICVPGAA